MAEARRTHGMSGTPIYQRWFDMIRRCCDPRVKSYYRYGAKGVTVSDDWMSFSNFYRDMGDAPDGSSLDRIDNSLGYSKENCRWANKVEQANNRSTCHYVYLLGEKLSCAAASRKYGVKYSRALSRLNDYGWSAEEAFELVERNK